MQLFWGQMFVIGSLHLFEDGIETACPSPTQLRSDNRTAAAPSKANAATAASELGLVRLRQLDQEALRPPRGEGAGKAKPPPTGAVPPAGFGLDVLPGAPWSAMIVPSEHRDLLTECVSLFTCRFIFKRCHASTSATAIDRPSDVLHRLIWRICYGHAWVCALMLIPAVKRLCPNARRFQTWFPLRFCGAANGDAGHARHRLQHQRHPSVRVPALDAHISAVARRRAALSATCGCGRLMPQCKGIDRILRPAPIGNRMASTRIYLGCDAGVAAAANVVACSGQTAGSAERARDSVCQAPVAAMLQGFAAVQ